ncbi:MAG: hypothetical protein EA376_01925 [Phycisphaeraceae bacterium]|nr:MAG: hypothetical protein EA376_01925 [Phycisphaeraceae bacterium]
MAMSQQVNRDDIREFLRLKGVPMDDAMAAAAFLERKCHEDSTAVAGVGALIGGAAGVAGGVPGVLMLATLTGFAGGMTASLLSESCQGYRELARRLRGVLREFR